LIYDSDSWNFGNPKGLFSIRFPGFRDYTISLVSEFNGVSV